MPNYFSDHLEAEFEPGRHASVGPGDEEVVLSSLFCYWSWWMTQRSGVLLAGPLLW